MINNHDELNEILKTKRNSGNVKCSFKDFFKTLDSQSKEIEKVNFIRELGYDSSEIKGNWVTVDKIKANKILKYILSIDMAYDVELESKSLAQTISDYFFKQFTLDAEYFTNGTFDEDAGYFKLSSWKPITDSTFDTGVIVIDRNKMGILWAEDND